MAHCGRACAKCGYCLDGLAVDALCPECNVWTPLDRDVLDPAAVRARRSRMIQSGVVLGILVAVLLILLLFPYFAE